MRHTSCLKLLSTGLLLAMLSPPEAGCADKREIILAAQHSYYNIPNQGLTEFQCSVVPDWAAMLKQELKSEVKPDNPALKLLDGVHFWVSVNRNGITKLTHQVDANPTAPSSIENLQQAISGIEETIDGFWKSASAFLLTSALPRADSAFELAERNGIYELSYREGDFDIVTSMDKDYAIVEIKVTSAAVTSSLKPKFTKTNQGFLLAAYAADYKLSSGGPSHVSVQIKYNEIEGFQLPTSLIVDTSGDEGSHTVLLQLRDYQIKKR